MADYILPLEQLIEQFAKLPGVGRKTASRYALSLIDWSPEQAQTFAETIISARSRIGRCKVCNNLCEGDLCKI